MPHAVQILMLDVGGVIAPDASATQLIAAERRLAMAAGTLYPLLFVDDKPRNTAVARDLGIDCIDYTTAEALAEALRARISRQP